MASVPADPNTSAGEACDPWAEFSNMFRTKVQPLPQPWGEMFGPLRRGIVDDLVDSRSDRAVA